MRTKEEIEADIAQVQAQIEVARHHVVVYAGACAGGDWLVCIDGHLAHTHGIDPANYAEYCAAYGQPDPNAAALTAADALAEAVGKWDAACVPPVIAASDVRTRAVKALTAYRAARGVKA